MSNEVRITVEGDDPAHVRAVVSCLSVVLDNNTVIQDEDGQEFDPIDYAGLAAEAALEAYGDDGVQLEDLQIVLVERITFGG